jgi:hypothetical protein
MALSDLERKILVKARALIRDGHSTYVCYAIDKSVGNSLEERYAKERLRLYVMKQLGEFATLDGWLSKRDGRWPSETKVRAARIAWITWMMGEA